MTDALRKAAEALQPFAEAATKRKGRYNIYSLIRPSILDAAASALAAIEAELALKRLAEAIEMSEPKGPWWMAATGNSLVGQFDVGKGDRAFLAVSHDTTEQARALALRVKDLLNRDEGRHTVFNSKGKPVQVTVPERD